MTTKREFFEEHMRYVAAQDIDTMVNITYTDDAVLYHNFPYFEGLPPYTHQGKEAIINAQITIFNPQNHGAIKAGEPLNFIEGEDFIFFQIPITTPDRGNWVNTDFWVIRDNNLAYQFVFGYRVDVPQISS
jgi:ketosteroid isomerase-like protein